MKFTPRAAATALFASGLVAIATAPAQTPPQLGSTPDTAARGPRDAAPGWRGPPGRPDWGGGLLNPPPFLMGLHLTQAQQDKVFSILYAAAPQLRDQSKALRAARAALMKAGTVENFDETTVQRQADAEAKADSELTLLRVRTDHQIYEVLTPDQRTRMRQMQKRHRQHWPHDPGNLPPA